MINKDITTAAELIKKWENFKSNAYLCQAGQWTIGYGTTGSWVKKGVSITKERAEELLLERIQVDYDYLKKLGLKLNANQFGAVLSFMYNTKRDAFKSSTLLVCLKSKNYEGAAEQFLRWKYYTDPVTKEKKVSNGLLNRRIDEKNLFLKPV